jgi:type I restriction enzyme, S subunit
MSSDAKTTAMKNDGKNALKPKLRFPEFRDGGKWEERKLGDVADVLMCKRIFANETNPTAGVPFYKIGTLGGVPDAFISRELFEDYKSKYNFPREGEILITCSGTVGKCIRYDGVEAYYQDSNIVWIDNPTLEVSNEFLLSILSGVNWVTLNSTTITRIYGLDLRGLTIKFPLEQGEQQKIADCLTSVDELIAAQARKVDALKTHKKGLMQQLFPSEGETQPRLRFPEFQDAVEWQTKAVGQLGEVVTGSTPSTARSEYYGGDRLFVSPTDISDDRFIDKTKTTLTGLGFKETRPIKARSILFVCIGSTIGKVAQNRHECATNQQINAVVPHSDNSDGFVYYALSGMADKIANLAGKQAVPIVNKSLFSSVELAVPKLPEQTRIADCLSSLDETIFAQTQKLEALKTHNKGLMQQLFPSPEEAL